MKKYLIILTLLVVGSCSIIEDDDILNEEDLGDLRLTSINISDFTNDAGARTIGSATITYNGDRIASIQWPSLDNSKLKFPDQPGSGTVTTTFEYDGAGRVTAFDYLQGGNSFRRMEFTYTGSGTVDRITTNGNDPLDSIFYDDVVPDLIINVTRNFGMTSGYEIGIVDSGDRRIVTGLNRTYDRTTFNDVKTVFGDFTNGMPGNLYMQSEVAQGRLLSLRLEDDRQDDFGNLGFFGSRTRFPDTFYVHPFLLFPDMFTDGDLLAEIFFEDWWEINQMEDVLFSYDDDEYVELEFIYSR